MAAHLLPPLLCCHQSAFVPQKAAFQHVLANLQAYITYGR
jgi:hypothetical protein